MALDRCVLDRVACELEQGGFAVPDGRGSGLAAGLRTVLRDHEFRLLWLGQGISLLGNQFYLVALPWLVLQLTGNAFAIGIVLALVSVPRALFMLLGGALTDRLSPRVVMLYSSVSRLVLVGSLAVATATGVVELWMLYGFALLLGLADALYFPGQAAIVPRLIGPTHLQTGNAVIQGTAQASVFVGPVLAGVLIAVLAGGETAVIRPDTLGIGIAFGVAAAAFLVSAVTLALISLPDAASDAGRGHKDKSVLAAMAEGLGYVWRDAKLRYYFILIAAVNLFMTGPLSVGIPVLADTRFAGGSVAFGTMLSAVGGGSLVGVVMAGLLPRPTGRRFTKQMLGLVTVMGIGVALVGALPTLVPAALAGFFVGFCQGYVTIEFITWLQLRTPAQMLGRTMSLLMFAVLGLGPVSTTVAGAAIQQSATLVLTVAGALIVAVGVFAAASPSVWRLGDESAQAAQRTPGSR
jgi:MFS family permease